jgi:hypothetical protein
MPITRTYRKWDSMLGRCYRPTHPAWPWYGGKGVQVCERWRSSYAHFLADMGEAPAGYWIDRIDTSKGYEPGNVRWVTPKQSAANRKQRGKVPESIKGRALAAGVPYQRVIQRVRAGWSVERAIAEPKRKTVMGSLGVRK